MKASDLIGPLLYLGARFMFERPKVRRAGETGAATGGARWVWFWARRTQGGQVDQGWLSAARPLDRAEADSMARSLAGSTNTRGGTYESLFLCDWTGAGFSQWRRIR